MSGAANPPKEPPKDAPDKPPADDGPTLRPIEDDLGPAKIPWPPKKSDPPPVTIGGGPDVIVTRKPTNTK